ncbi:hypothetical protein Tco_1564099 [Tanacetum coccineum]
MEKPKIISFLRYHVIFLYPSSCLKFYDVIRIIFESDITAIKECSTCGVWYTADFCCSKKGLEDKILVPKPPRNCARCGTPVDGPNCQGCALLRKKFKEDLFTYCVENEFFKDLQNTSESSNDNTNVGNAPQEPFVVKHNPGENSSPSPLHIDHCCHECGDSLDGIFCRQCTCKSCGKGAHYGYNCPPKVPIISNPEPCKNQTLGKHLQNLQSLQQQCLFRTCQKCGCNEYDGVLILIVKNEMGTPINVLTPTKPPQYTVNHPIFNSQNELLNSSNKLMEQMATLCDLVGQAIQKKEEEERIAEDQAAKDRYWKIPICYDDDEDNTIAITPVLPIEEPDNSLNIDYVDASPPDVEIVSLEVVEIVDPEAERIDDDILLTIKDDILHEKIFPPADRSDLNHEEFAEELTHIMSLPNLECFKFKIEPISEYDIYDPGFDFPDCEDSHARSIHKSFTSSASFWESSIQI